MKKEPYFAEFGPIFVRFLVGFHLFYGNWGRLVQRAAYNDYLARLAAKARGSGEGKHP